MGGRGLTCFICLSDVGMFVCRPFALQWAMPLWVEVQIPRRCLRDVMRCMQCTWLKLESGSLKFSCVCMEFVLYMLCGLQNFYQSSQVSTLQLGRWNLRTVFSIKLHNAKLQVGEASLVN